MEKFKILIFNLIVLIFIFCFAEFLAYKQACLYFENPPQYSLKKENYPIENLKNNMRAPFGLEYKKAPVLIYGCSYAYAIKDL